MLEYRPFEPKCAKKTLYCCYSLEEYRHLPLTGKVIGRESRAVSPINELRNVVGHWRMGYNHYRPHSSLDYMAPAVFVASCL